MESRVTHTPGDEMESRADRDRKFRSIVFAGLLVSAVAHAAVLGVGRLTVETAEETPRDIRLFELPQLETSQPLEVLAVRDPISPTRRVAPARRTVGGGGSGASPASGAGASGPAASPVFARVPATLSAAIPDAMSLLKKIAVPEEPENPKASYAEVSDFLVDAAPNPRPLRPIDDRSVEELAAIAASRGRGVTVGGGYCPPGHDGGLRQSPVNRSIISPGVAVGPSL